MAKKALSLILGTLIISGVALPVRGTSNEPSSATKQTETNLDDLNFQNHSEIDKNKSSKLVDITLNTAYVASLGA